MHMHACNFWKQYVYYLWTCTWAYVCYSCVCGCALLFLCPCWHFQVRSIALNDMWNGWKKWMHTSVPMHIWYTSTQCRLHTHTWLPVMHSKCSCHLDFFLFHFVYVFIAMSMMPLCWYHFIIWARRRQDNRTVQCVCGSLCVFYGLHTAMCVKHLAYKIIIIHNPVIKPPI